MYLGLYEGRRDMRNTVRNMIKFRPTFPPCVHRKVSDERPKEKTLEMGDFPLQVLESKRKERLAELKAECIELKNQLSEHSLDAALIREAQAEGLACGDSLLSSTKDICRHSKSMHELRRLPKGGVVGGTSASTLTVNTEDSMRKRREERLKNIRRELEEFAIKYSIGEYGEKIDGLDRRSASLRKAQSGAEEMSKSSLDIGISSAPQISAGPLIRGEDAVNASIFLKIQRQREQELQRARMELKHLAFRLKHKLDEESSSGSTENGIDS